MSADVKATLRRAALASRLALGGDQGAIDANLGSALTAHADAALSGYWPMRGEADPVPALLRHRGPVGLPVVTGKGVPLLFRRWNGGALQPGPFGTSHPAESAGLLIPEVLIVPLAAFDRAGHRIGYGGGYYDRTLQLLRKSASVMAIGLAFASQEVAEIPSEAFDQPLDLVVTDRDVFVTKR